MATSSVPEWYETEETITASVKIKGMEADVFAVRFTEKCCVVEKNNSPYMKCCLNGDISPQSSKFTRTSLRLELKMCKKERRRWAELGTWTWLEGRNAESSGQKGTQLSKGMDVPTGHGGCTPCEPGNCTPCGLVGTCSEVSPMRGSDTAQCLPSGCTPPGCIQEISLQHIQHEWHEKDQNKVLLTLMVPSLKGDSSQVTWDNKSVWLYFQTNSKELISQMSVDSTTQPTFLLKILLANPIVPEQCSHIVRTDCLELLIMKSHPMHWVSLEEFPPPGGAESDPFQRAEPPCPQGAELEGPEYMDISGPLEQDDVPNHLSMVSGDQAGAAILSHTNIRFDQGKPERVVPPPSNHLRDAKTMPNNDRGVTHPPQSTPRNTYPAQGAPLNTYPAPDAGTAPRNTYPAQGAGTAPRNTYPIQGAGTAPRNTYPIQGAGTANLNAEDPFNRSQRLMGPCLTGLHNLGNTCYMNSVLQCLSNTICLRDFFITGSYLKDVNKKNVLGYNGDLATSFCKVVRKLWSGEQQSFAPDRLKDVIEKRHSSYDGIMQHDAHELMSLLLDGLHEDLNRVSMKPQTEAVVSDGQLDVEVAKQAWKVHRMRNDSFLVDHFQGLFRSTLVCSECSKVSVTFDPFMTMSVPIPNNLRQLPVFFVPKEPDTLPTKYVLKLPPEANLELLKASVARKTGIPMPQLRVFEAYKGKFQTMHSDNQKPIKSIGDNDIIIVAEVLSETKGRVVEFNVIQRVQLPIFPKKCTNCGKVAEEGVKLLRCSKCKAVGYCNEACQRNDWSAHKLKCKAGVPSPVGLPFVISLPTSKLTYKNITSLAEKFARRSVECKRLTSEASDDEWRDVYVLTPANQYGEWVAGANALVDKGDQLLDIESKFLTMDWKNNLSGGLIAITEKATLEHKEDPSGSAKVAKESGPIKLEHCIELFTQPETLLKDEAWYCPSCKVHREATKQMSLWQVPSILIIHLKRFSYTNIRRNKIDVFVEFPLRGLDIAPYMLGEAAKLVSSDNPPIYDLYAIANHYGNTYNGHYTSMVKPTGGLSNDKGEPEWLCYDDSNVWRIHEKHVLGKEAYILFYMRRENVAG